MGCGKTKHTYTSTLQWGCEKWHPNSHPFGTPWRVEVCIYIYSRMSSIHGSLPRESRMMRRTCQQWPVHIESKSQWNAWIFFKIMVRMKMSRKQTTILHHCCTHIMCTSYYTKKKYPYFFLHLWYWFLYSELPVVANQNDVNSLW